MIHEIKVLNTLIRGSLLNRSPAQIDTIILDSGRILDKLQYQAFEYLINLVFAFSSVLTLVDIAMRDRPLGELYLAPSFPGFVATGIFAFLLRSKRIELTKMIRILIALFVGILAFELRSSGGVVNTGMLYMMSLPFLAQIYGGALFSTFIALATAVAAIFLTLLHDAQNQELVIPRNFSDQVESTAVAVLGFLIVVFFTFLQGLRHKRTRLIERSLFFERNSQSTVTAMREMAGIVAHQMNTPLSTYLLAIEQVRMRLPPEAATDSEVQSILQRLESSVDRINRINQSLLVVTRDTAKSSPSEIDLLKTVNTSIEAFRNSVPHGISTVSVLDNHFSGRVIAPEGALAHFVWRFFSISQQQLSDAPVHETDDLHFRVEVTEEAEDVRLALDAIVDRLRFPDPVQTAHALTQLGAHLLGSSAAVTATQTSEHHIRIAITLRRSSKS